jgi:hypothetical protein
LRFFVSGLSGAARKTIGYDKTLAANPQAASSRSTALAQAPDLQ